jgi:hypothetical protein
MIWLDKVFKCLYSLLNNGNQIGLFLVQLSTECVSSNWFVSSYLFLCFKFFLKNLKIFLYFLLKLIFFNIFILFWYFNIKNNFKTIKNIILIHFKKKNFKKQLQLHFRHAFELTLFTSFGALTHFTCEFRWEKKRRKKTKVFKFSDEDCLQNLHFRRFRALWNSYREAGMVPPFSARTIHRNGESGMRLFFFKPLQKRANKEVYDSIISIRPTLCILDEIGVDFLAYINNRFLS